MAVAQFLASSHYYSSIADVDDVQDIIDALGTILLTTNSPAWSESPAGTFISPVDAGGRWFSVAVSRIGVDTLELVVKDQYATTIRTNRIDINTAGSPAVEVKIYSGQYHLWIDSCRATYENFRSGILDLSPQIQTAWNTVVYAQAHRDSGGSVGSQYIHNLSLSADLDNAYMTVWPQALGDSGRAIKTDAAGNTIYWPLFIRNSVHQLKGRMYQILICPVDLAYGSEVTVPIDTGVTAKFRVSGAVYWGGGPYKLAVRAD